MEFVINTSYHYLKKDMRDQIKVSKKSFAGYFVLVALGVLAWVMGALIVNEVRKDAQEQLLSKQEQVLSKIEEAPSHYPDYEAVRGKSPDPKIKVLQLTKDCPEGGCVNTHPASIDFDGIKKWYKASGEFSRAYLYAELLVDFQRPLTNWDDFYFTINFQGGHLISEESALKTPPGNISTYLYDLRSISFYPTNIDKNRKTNKKDNINFFHFLENESKLYIWISVSSNRPGRTMKDVSIFYECFEGSNCSIEAAD